MTTVALKLTCSKIRSIYHPVAPAISFLQESFFVLKRNCILHGVVLHICLIVSGRFNSFFAL